MQHRDKTFWLNEFPHCHIRRCRRHIPFLCEHSKLNIFGFALTEQFNFMASSSSPSHRMQSPQCVCVSVCWCSCVSCSMYVGTGTGHTQRHRVRSVRVRIYINYVPYRNNVIAPAKYKAYFYSLSSRQYAIRLPSSFGIFSFLVILGEANVSMWMAEGTHAYTQSTYVLTLTCTTQLYTQSHHHVHVVCAKIYGTPQPQHRWW